jgi:superfamily I DNA and/or RNA helicase
LGVVAFNREQSDLIDELLGEEAKRSPWIQERIEFTEETLEPFFIKNLENVQGDERDVIFISATYGPDPETGKVYQRFGPLGGTVK